MYGSELTTTHLDNGEVEQYWTVDGTNTPGRTKNLIYSYGYKFTNGDVFQCVELSLEQCRVARDKWSIAQNKNPV